MPSVALPVELGLCTPFAGGNSTKATNFGLKPNDGVNPTPVKLKRVDFNWWTNQPTNPSTNPAGKNDTIDFTDINLITDAAHANGYKLIGMVGYTPPWAAGNKGFDKNFPRDQNNGYRDYANFMYLVCKFCEARHPGTLIAVECWNEPNQAPFMTNPDVVKYTAMVQTAYTAQKDGTIAGRTDNGLRDVNTVQFITGGTGAAPIVGSQFRHLNWSSYIISNAPHSFDHIGIHPYPSDHPLGTSNGFDPGWNDIPGISAALHTAGRDDAQIVATEIGWQTPSVTTLQHAADFLGQSWTWWQARSGDRALGGINYNLGPFCLFECDDTTNTTDANDLQGLYTYGTGQGDGVAKTVSGTPIFLNKFLDLASTSATDNPPTVGIVSPVDGATVNGTVSVFILVSDDITPAASLVVKLKNGTTVLGNATYTPSVFGFNYRFDINTLNGSWPDDDYVFRATVNDGVNTVVTSTAVTLTVLNGAPAGLTVTSVTPDAGDPAGATSVVIAGTGFTGVSGATGVQLVSGATDINAASYHVDSDTQITAVTPPQPNPVGVGGLSFPIYFATGAGTPTQSDVDGMIADGATGMRCSIQWDGADPGFGPSGYNGTGVYDNSYDSIIQYCNNAVCLNGKVGFDVILQIATGATFGGKLAPGLPGAEPGMAFNHNANRDGSPGNTGPVDVPHMLSNFAVNVGTRYAPGSTHGTITALEILNEPNHAKCDVGIWVVGTTSIPCSGVADTAKGAAYFEYLARVYPPLHALGLTVLTGGLGGVQDSTGDTPGDQFLTNMLGASFTVGATTYHGSDGLFDHFNFHPYSHPDSWTTDAAKYNPLTQRGGRGYALMIFKIVPILTTAGLISKGIWVTEVGNPTNDPDIQTASDNMTDIMNVWNSQPWGGGGGNPLCWFTYQDKIVDPKNRPYGVVDATNTKKQPFWQTLHDLATKTAGSKVPTTFDIVVVKGAITSATVAGDQFTYGGVAGGPAITSVTPTHGPAAGGTAMALVGTDFTGTTSVKIGTTACTSVVVVDDNHITCVSPAGTAGTHTNVRVTNPTATSPVTTSSAWTYDNAVITGAPAVTSITPTTGSSAGGTLVGISGTNLVPFTNVSFGGVASPSATAFGSAILAIAPPGSGAVNVRVTTPISQSAAVPADIFTYTGTPGIPTLVSGAPLSGPATGGTVVTLRGNNFVNVLGVKVGGVAATQVTVLNTTTLTFKTPARPKGTYDIAVVNSTGQSGAPSVVKFTYGNNPPIADIGAVLLADNITSLSPVTGGKIGGTVTFFMLASDDSDTTVMVKLYEGLHHENVLATAVPWTFGYYVTLDTRGLTSGVHTFWVQGGPDSGGASGPFSSGYRFTVSNPPSFGLPPPKG